jgi:nucleoside diphosphate kinase
LIEHAPFYEPDLHRNNVHATERSVELVEELLQDPGLREQIITGNVTFAMIRPNVGPDANILGLSDQGCADQIEMMIHDLGFLAKFSFQFTPEAAEEFYQGAPKMSMTQETARDPSQYESRWQEFINFMTSGSVTAILLHSPDGKAIEKWRAHLGHWNIDDVRDMDTIRGKLGVNKYNNLVHGSDSPEAVLRELNIVSRILRQNIEP